MELKRDKWTNLLIRYNRINPTYLVIGFIFLNFLLRLTILNNTTLFRFYDYSTYLDATERIINGDKVWLQSGNSLFMISWLGYYTFSLFGSVSYFLVLNCLLGSISVLILYFLTVKVTENATAGLLMVLISTLYTEFMVFSAVFYTPVIMIFLLSLFLFSLFFYLTGTKKRVTFLSSASLILIFLLTFFFKPELKYLPWLLLFLSIIFFRSERRLSLKILLLFFFLFTSSWLLEKSSLITEPEENVSSNDFIFFGHTDYGGDGGEGSFVYSRNRQRYEEESKRYFSEGRIQNPNVKDYNNFQLSEIKRYITEHPLAWINLQAKKFFRTFGVVPEGSSFKVLYTGLLRERLWLTSFVVVAPVALIIIAFVVFFPSLSQQRASSLPQDSGNVIFRKLFLLLFLYYLVASVFYGQYQERYRIPIMVLFIIPALGYFISAFDRKEFLSRRAISIKGIIIILLLSIWLVQSRNAISDKDRLQKALETVSGTGK